jgi:hypothetical protein
MVWHSRAHQQVVIHHSSGTRKALAAVVDVVVASTIGILAIFLDLAEFNSRKRHRRTEPELLSRRRRDR